MKTYTLTFLLCIIYSFSFGLEDNSYDISTNEIQRVRINFTGPEGNIRPLLLGFTPNDAATDGFDYGYDALNIDNFPNDLNWMINNQRYIIQGVGSFNETKTYPLGMFLSNSGTIKISLQALENFPQQPIEVFIYDTLQDSYTLINQTGFSAFVTEGNYIDRFYITFSNETNNESLNINTSEIEKTSFHYTKADNLLSIKTNSVAILKTINIYTINGQLLKTINNIELNDVTVFMQNANQIIILNIISDYGILTQKLII